MAGGGAGELRHRASVGADEDIDGHAGGSLLDRGEGYRCRRADLVEIRSDLADGVCGGEGVADSTMLGEQFAATLLLSGQGPFAPVPGVGSHRAPELMAMIAPASAATTASTNTTAVPRFKSFRSRRDGVRQAVERLVALGLRLVAHGRFGPRRVIALLPLLTLADRSP